MLAVLIFCPKVLPSVAEAREPYGAGSQAGHYKTCRAAVWRAIAG